MNLEAQLAALKTENRNLPLTERATLSCGLAKQLEKVGKYVVPLIPHREPGVLAAKLKEDAKQQKKEEEKEGAVGW